MKEPATKWLITAAIAAPLVLWITWGLWGVKLFALYWSGSTDVSALGPTGDLFGGVNALFAAFAFAGVALAAYFQYRTNELAQHTLEITLQAQALASFEPLFFKLLERHDQMYAALKLELRRTIQTAFPGPNENDPAQLAHWLRDRVKTEQHISIGAIHGGTKPAKGDFDWLMVNFEDLYITNEHVLGPFYRTTYHLFNLIDKSTLSEPDKIRYANIARSAMNRDELLMLMLNCAQPRGTSMKALIEQYGVLKHISTDRESNALDVALAATFFTPTQDGPLKTVPPTEDELCRSLNELFAMDLVPLGVPQRRSMTSGFASYFASAPKNHFWHP